MLLFIWCCIQHIDAHTLLRGVATNQWDGGCNDFVLLNRMSWYYNWATKPNTNVINCTLPNARHVEYVPMIWGRGSVVDGKGSPLDIIKNLPPKGTFSALMAFNEPNFREQSNLLPKEAADLWKQVQTQLINAGIYDNIQIGAPSAAPGGTLSDYSDPVLWLREFFGNCTTCRFDFQNWHIYDCNGQYFDAGGFNYWIGRGKSLGRPLWLTEFDCPNPPNEAMELKWMNAVLPSLDSDVNVTRYSWFTARPGSESPTVGIINALLTPINQPQALTAIGNRYNNAGDCLIKNDAIVSVDVNCTITMGSTIIVNPINNTNTNNNNNNPTTTPTIPNNNNNNNNNNPTKPQNNAHSLSSITWMMVCVAIIVLTLL